MAPYIIGTRGSTLAIEQTKQIMSKLRMICRHDSFILRQIKTLGDRDKQTALYDFKQTGVFTNEIEHALLTHSIDIAVHSLKDVYAHDHKDFILAAITQREDARDVFISRDGRMLSELPKGALVATSSLRRKGQLLAAYPHIRPASIRGPIDQRLQQLFAGKYDGIILAAAGIHRLNKYDKITQYLPLEQFTPAPGQGALAIQCRRTDVKLQSNLRQLNDPYVQLATTVEREFTAKLGQHDHAPIGAYAICDEKGINLQIQIVSPDGKHIVNDRVTGKTKGIVINAALKVANDKGVNDILAEEWMAE